jgi:hypothetical protein
MYGTGASSNGYGALRVPMGGVILGRAWFFREHHGRGGQKADAAQLSHDSLTGLVNRSVFNEAIQQAILRMGRGARGFAVLCLDLDHFKDINDTLGHQAGDRTVTAGGAATACVLPHHGYGGTIRRRTNSEYSSRTSPCPMMRERSRRP